MGLTINPSLSSGQLASINFEELGLEGGETVLSILEKLFTNNPTVLAKLQAGGMDELEAFATLLKEKYVQFAAIPYATLINLILNYATLSTTLPGQITATKAGIQSDQQSVMSGVAANNMQVLINLVSNQIAVINNLDPSDPGLTAANALLSAMQAYQSDIANGTGNLNADILAINQAGINASGIAGSHFIIPSLVGQMFGGTAGLTFDANNNASRSQLISETAGGPSLDPLSTSNPVLQFYDSQLVALESVFPGNSSISAVYTAEHQYYTDITAGNSSALPSDVIAINTALNNVTGFTPPLPVLLQTLRTAFGGSNVQNPANDYENLVTNVLPTLQQEEADIQLFSGLSKVEMQLLNTLPGVA